MLNGSRAMRNQLLAIVVAAGMSVLAVPPAGAAGGDVTHGGCFFDTMAQPSYPHANPAVNTGVIGDLSTTKSTETRMPIGATVTCWIDVNNVEAPGTRFSYSGDGVQAGVNPVSYVANDWDWVVRCQEVTYADGTTDPATCPDPIEIQIPPECIASCDILGTIDQFIVYAVDPVVCPALSKLAGSYPGGVTIDPTGDVTVPDPLDLFDGPAYDCPPYVTP